MTLIKKLQENVSDENILFIEELSQIIIEENIKTLEELKEYEIEYNKENGKVLSIEEIIKKCIENIDKSPYEYDGLLYDQIQMLKKERKMIDDELIDNKILHIIKYYYLTKRENPFPYITYQLIITNKL
jgi:hypothetical protein